MIKHVSTLILILGISNGFAQMYIGDSLMKILHEKGIADKKFIPKGKKKDNLKIGTWSEFAFERFTYYVQNGETTNEFDKQIMLEYKGEYVAGKREGLWTVFAVEADNYTRHKICTITFVDGKKEGPVTFFYTSGEVAAECTHVDTYLHGTYTVYYKTKEIVRKYEILYDKIQGNVTSHYISGEKRIEQNFRNGLRNGDENQYYESGKLKSKNYYVKDTLQGESWHYYENGQVKQEATYENGLVTYLKYYYDSGQLWVHREYKDGKEYNIVELNDASGNPLDYGTIKDGNGTIKYYNNDGVIYLIITFENGLIISEERLGDWK